MLNRKNYIICVDDDSGLLQGLRQELSTLQKKYNNLRIEIADSGEDGLDLIKDSIQANQIIPVVISDQLMPGMKGDEFLAQVHQLLPHTKKILLTGQAGTDAVGRAVNQANLYRFIAKPWDPADLLLTVEQALKSYFTDINLAAKNRNTEALNQYAVRLGAEVRLLSWMQVLIQMILADAVEGTKILLTVMLENDKPYAIKAQKNNPKVEILEVDTPQNLIVPELLPAAKKPQSDAFVHQTPQQAACLIHFVKETKWLGYLYIEHNAPNIRYFDTIELEFYNSLAKIIPISLDNTILYESLEEKVRERTKTIEQINKDLTDSILYARRIQFAILPAPELLQQAFPDSFILYQPKDIVSGDFYWFARQGAYLYVSAVDCTGHGVPGAFMSVLANSYLNQIVKEQNITDVGKILSTLNQKVLETLRQNDAALKVDDGMDIALCRIHLATYEVQYAGANRPILHLCNNELMELKPDRMAIGGAIIQNIETDNRTYSVQTFELRPNNALYLFTDGITDQFGGEKQKKLTFSRLQEWLVQGADLPMPTQKNTLMNNLIQWRGKTAQIDDILVIGLRRMY